MGSMLPKSVLVLLRLLLFLLLLLLLTAVAAVVAAAGVADSGRYDCHIYTWYDAK